MHHSKAQGMEEGLRRVGEVLLGCVVGLVVSWLMSKLWPPLVAKPSHSSLEAHR